MDYSKVDIEYLELYYGKPKALLLTKFSKLIIKVDEDKFPNKVFYFNDKNLWLYYDKVGNKLSFSTVNLYVLLHVLYDIDYNKIVSLIKDVSIDCLKLNDKIELIDFMSLWEFENHFENKGYERF